MKATFLSFARGVATMSPRKWVLEVDGVKSRAAADYLAGQAVIWTTSSGKRIVGKVVGAHGGNGHVMANFKKGPPHTVRGHKAELRDRPGSGKKGAAKAKAPKTTAKKK